MKIVDFKKKLLTTSSGRTELPDDILDRIYTGLEYIAADTIPLRLAVSSPEGKKILRRLDENLYIRYPDVPTSDNSNVDIDDSLLDALALYVMAGMETQRAPIHMGMYYRRKDMHELKLVDSYMVVANREGLGGNAQEDFA